LRKIFQKFRLVNGALLGAVFLLSAMPLDQTKAQTQAQNQAQSGKNSTAQLNKRLFSAVAANNLAVVRSSITAGADITGLNQDGQTAAGLAIEKGYFDIAHYIIGVRNQRTALDEENQNLGRTRANRSPQNVPDPVIPGLNPPLLRQQTATQAPATPLDPPALPARSFKRWPANKPNPFASNAETNSLPIIGTLQKPSVQPDLPNKPVTSNIRQQAPPQGNEIQGNENQEVDLIDRMWNRITNIF